MSRPALRIVSVGESTIDQYVDLNREFVGGISLNYAVHSKRSGAEVVSLVSRIGDDHSARILEAVTTEGVDASHVQIQRGATARQNITLTANGERIFPAGGYHPGVLAYFRLQAADLHFLQLHNLLVSALFQQVEPLFRQAMQELPFEGWRVADFLDLSDYHMNIGVIEHLHERLTIAFVSGTHEMVERLRPLSRSTNCLIVVTLGAEGSAALVKGEPLYQSSHNVTDIVDSTGCGDAFQAAFTVSYWRDGNVRRALECGAQRASLVLQHYGALG